MTVLVRPLRREDETRWCELFSAYVAFYRATVAESVITGTWHRLLVGRDGMVGFVAVDQNQQIVGLVTAVFHRSTWSPTYYCYLEDLFVDPACRGAGAGRALIEAVYAEADKRGATRTYWATETNNSTARALYDRLATLSPFVQYRR